MVCIIICFCSWTSLSTWVFSKVTHEHEHLEMTAKAKNVPYHSIPTPQRWILLSQNKVSRYCKQYLVSKMSWNDCDNNIRLITDYHQDRSEVRTDQWYSMMSPVSCLYVSIWETWSCIALTHCYTLPGCQALVSMGLLVFEFTFSLYPIFFCLFVQIKYHIVKTGLKFAICWKMPLHSKVLGYLLSVGIRGMHSST